MAYSRSVRARARKHYVEDGLSYRRIADELDVGKTTLLRWSSQEDWEHEREQQELLERESRKLLLEMLRAAAESRDPQQIYAASQVAELAGVDFSPRESAHPPPKKVAVVLMDVLGQHHTIGPVVRRYRNEVIRLVLEEVDRLEAREGGEVR